MSEFNLKKSTVKKKINNDIYILHLFIAGTTANSSRAIINIKNICEQYLFGKYKLEVIDIYQLPDRLVSEQITAMPVLIKKFPLPEKRMVGDLSNTKLVLKGLDIKLHEEVHASELTSLKE